MTYCESDHLDQFYELIRLDLRVERVGDWWQIHEIHRHETGQMGRCRPTTYEHLTAGEACDVIAAVVDALLHPELPSKRRSTS